MYRLSSSAVAACSAAVLAAIVLLPGRVCRAEEPRRAGVQQPENRPRNIRPLIIEHVESNITNATVSGPEFGASTLFVGTEDTTSSLAKRLRTDYQLNDVVAGEPS